MLYRDLIQFDPIESIIQLRNADELAAAKQLVQTYVISDRMADQLVNIVIPQLQFLTPRDNRGVLIVGNYGTGKSHLMSVISAVAEYPDCVPLLNHPDVHAAAEQISGQFKVLRTEVGGVTGSLRDMLLRDLEDALTEWGTPYTFPPADQVTNNKTPLIEALAVFQERYPGYGILLVVDELLDYLRTREERALILDLGFLRELGEVAAATPFRFLGGVQETLFDNPRFTFVAAQLRRVRDRFEQVRIAREDIAYVVAHRLLRKDDRQLAWITEHLRTFAPLYDRLAERLEEFVQLFPIHPVYIETFERVYVAEKREVLKTFSQAIRALLDQEVPADRPGLIAYDHYWNMLRDNPSMRSLPEVSEVIDKSMVLEGRVRHAYTRPHLQAMAERIIHALSVQRLTTSDIRARLGVTPEELRDGLCLYTPMPTPVASADFLLDQVQVALREIMRTVSGQYITFNSENGQYYLDVEKDVDFAAKIEERGDFMDDADLSRYFFDALQQLLHLSETTYVTNFRIWLYELPWVEKRVTRSGYLFFGPPDERSTAQPPRDFYLYILPPYINRDWFNPELSDEVILGFTGLDQTFKAILRTYAGARALAHESSQYRQQYAEAADAHLRTLLTWLREQLVDHLQVIYEGVSRPVTAVLAEARSTASQGLEDLLRIVGSHLLAPQFAERYPVYPDFGRLSQPISEAAREASALEAIRCLAGRGCTRLARAVLAGLSLLETEGTQQDLVVRPYQSPYARHYLDVLQRKQETQVVNHGEIIEQVSGGITPIFKDVEFHLEPEWVAVVLVSLVYHGDIVLNLGGHEELDAGNVEQAALRAMSDLVDFRFYKRPRTLPVNLWSAIYEGLGLSPGLVRDENERERGLREHFLPLITTELERVATLEGRLQQGLRLWNTSIFTDRFTLEVEQGMVVGIEQPSVTLASTDLLVHVRGYKRFLETLSRFNTVGKLRNLRLTLSEIQSSLDDRKAVTRAADLLDLVAQLQPLTTYLAEAQANLPAHHPWAERAEDVQRSVIDDMRRLGRGEDARSGLALLRQLERLKQDYVMAYAERHRALRLGPAADERRQRLYHDPRLQVLQTLAGIELLPRAELDAWAQEIAAVQACPTFYEGAIADTPTCPDCHLRPAQLHLQGDLDQSLEDFDQRLDAILLRWRQALRDALTSDTARHSLDAMTPAERVPVDAFLAQPVDATSIPPAFVATATQALRGIDTLALPVADLLSALGEGGMPCTREALETRFRTYIENTMRGHDDRSTRLILQ
ncbi:MAG: ATP-binding protein [Anaerolineae bacterium]|nr:ATP-binding protein [Anaerolineae bacterium]